MLLDVKRSHPWLTKLTWAAAATIVALLVLTGDFAHETARLGGTSEGVADFLAALRWAMPGAFLAALAWRDHGKVERAMAEVLAAIFTYGVAAQLLPSDMLAWFASATAMAALFALRERVAAAVALVAIAGLWAIPPALVWSLAGVMALSGEPMLVSELPSLRVTGLQLLPAAVSLGAALWIHWQRLGRFAPHGAVLFGLTVLVPVHIAFKNIMAIDSAAAFIHTGLAERTMWEALLLAGAYSAYSLHKRYAASRQIAWSLAGLAAAHWCWFTLVLHNPLLVGQHVGPVPLANLLLTAYGLPVAALLWLLNGQAAEMKQVRVLMDSAVMALISMLAISSLRQMFSGTDLTAVPLTQTEDLLRSLTGIVLAILFLLWGARQNLRSWRIGSLAVMLLAVVKVFLVDAAGLEGLARIASFVALGFSLIGIGWFYARQLRRDPEATEGQQI